MCAALAKSQCTTAAGSHHGTSLAVDPDKVTAADATRSQFRSTRTQHLQMNTFYRTGRLG